MIKIECVVQKQVKSVWVDVKSFATKEGAIKRILKLRKWFKSNKYRIKLL